MALLPVSWSIVVGEPRPPCAAANGAHASDAHARPPAPAAFSAAPAPAPAPEQAAVASSTNAGSAPAVAAAAPTVVAAAAPAVVADAAPAAEPQPALSLCAALERQFSPCEINILIDLDLLHASHDSSSLLCGNTLRMKPGCLWMRRGLPRMRLFVGKLRRRIICSSRRSSPLFSSSLSAWGGTHAAIGGSGKNVGRSDCWRMLWRR